MEILKDYTMPPFARIQWASKEIKDKYEPMWNQAKKFFVQMEKLSVIHGLRDATTDTVRPNEFMGRQQHYLKRGLYFLPFHKVGAYTGSSSYHPPVVNGQPWNYYGCIARNIETALKFYQYNGEHVNDKTNHRGIGKLLGYPDCCIDSFEKVFLQDMIVDSTWHRALATSDEYIKSKDGNTITLTNIPWQVNPLFRPFYVMGIFHNACSFSCKKTIEMAKTWFDLAEELNVEGLKELELFLRLPVEWNSYKGIAYIKTPLFKISVNSNFSTEKYIVRIEGTYYPMDAKRGLEFPWDNQTRMLTYKKEENKLQYWSDEK